MPELIDWTPEDAIAYEATWNEPHMKKALLKLKLGCLVPGDRVLVVSGVDLKEVASQAYAHAQGRASIFSDIEELKPVKSRTQLPPPFQRTPPPKPEPES